MRKIEDTLSYFVFVYYKSLKKILLKKFKVYDIFLSNEEKELFLFAIKFYMFKCIIENRFPKINIETERELIDNIIDDFKKKSLFFYMVDKNINNGIKILNKKYGINKGSILYSIEREIWKKMDESEIDLITNGISKINEYERERHIF